MEFISTQGRVGVPVMKNREIFFEFSRVQNALAPDVSGIPQRAASTAVVSSGAMLMREKRISGIMQT